MQTTADAVIVGGGVMGCSILYNLARQRMRNLVLIERETIGSGQTGRSMTMCRMHYSDPVATSLAWKSLDIYRNFEEAIGGPSGFVRTGYILVVGPEDKEAMEQNVAMQQKLGVSTKVISKADALEVAPMLDFQDVAGIAYEPESGYGDSYAVTSTYARQAREMGANILLETPVTGIQVSNGRVSGVETPDGDISTSTVIVAAGPWSRTLFQGIGLDFPIHTVRHQLTVLNRPTDLIPDHPMVADLINELSFRPDGTNLTMIGLGVEEADIESWNPGVDMAIVSEVSTKLVRRCPLMAQASFRGGWSCLFDVTPDWYPVLDNVEGIEGLYCAAGFSGHGFKLAPMIGVVMAELITQGQATSVDITPLRWNRFQEGNLVRSSYGYNVLA